jgi:hypothetical protein
MKYFDAVRARSAKAVIILCLVAVSGRQSRAGMACPTLLIDGSADGDSIAMTFKNVGKMPIQLLELDCAKANTTRRSTCDTETGIFFPGTTYPIHFSYAGGNARFILVSLNSARLAHGYMWQRGRDQACHTLKIPRKKAHP